MYKALLNKYDIPADTIPRTNTSKEQNFIFITLDNFPVAIKYLKHSGIKCIRMSLQDYKLNIMEI